MSEYVILCAHGCRGIVEAGAFPDPPPGCGEHPDALTMVVAILWPEPCLMCGRVGDDPAPTIYEARCPQCGLGVPSELAPKIAQYEAWRKFSK